MHKTKIAAFRITSEQFRAIERRAEECGVPPSVYMRQIILQAVTKRASEGYLRIREPDGATI